VITAVIAAVVYGVRALESQLMTDDGLWLWRRDVEPQWSLPATTAASTAATNQSKSTDLGSIPVSRTSIFAARYGYLA